MHGIDIFFLSFSQMMIPPSQQLPLSLFLRFVHLSLLSMLKSSGHITPSDVAVSTLKWGRNEFDIPVPSFFDLYAVRITFIWLFFRSFISLLNDNFLRATPILDYRFYLISLCHIIQNATNYINIFCNMYMF